MIGSWLRSSRPRMVALALCVMAILVGIGLWSEPSSGSAVGLMQKRAGNAPASGTPVTTASEASDPLDGDPLDGEPGNADPLDGEPRGADREAPASLARLDIERSGRPSEEARSLPSYDEDPATAWRPDAANGESWVWFDLGAERSVREVRWLAEGSGVVEVAVSSDRRRWETVDRLKADGAWQGATLREEARYVRLSVLADDQQAPPALAEVAIYGRDRGGSVAVAQEAEPRRERRRARARQAADADTRRGAAVPDADDSGGSSGEDRPRRRGGRVHISAEPGETRCSGDRERCQARQGEVTVEEDCAVDGSCTIDIRADGGTAICDATGGDESRAGRGEGRRGGDGGECEAVANGGAVAIGDIDP